MKNSLIFQRISQNAFLVAIFLFSCSNIFSQGNPIIYQLESRLMSEPFNLEIITKLAQAYYKQEGMLYNAIFYAEKGLKIDPDNLTLYDLKIRSLINNNQNDEALLFINSNIRRKGSSASIDFLRRGMCKANLGNNQSALEDFETAYSIDPDNTEIQFALGYTKAILQKDKYYTNKYIDMALNKIEKEDQDIFFNNKNLADIYYRKALQLKNNGKEDDAEKYIEKSLKLNAFDPDANIWEGKKFMHLRWYQRALDHFEKAISLNNNNYKRSDILGYIAICKYYILYRKNDINKALNDEVYSALMNAYNEGNNFGAVFFFLGRLKYNQGNFEDAARFFTKAIDYEHNEYEYSKEAADGNSFFYYISEWYKEVLYYMESNNE